ncbi:hypothetical protein PAXRUDRAFT_159569 [Paxillus rubicundulus Ve08.2h10]|uniref:Terpene synthase n=1 Tax=Paxillus rubicundulus Ve08.2h10 TaxID=930991 RepID=A0A0D0DG09_9AGAM|nr:hypothetical protein PAXRUDRAFT_159569 [Paxillus rubicundulus Ve08.2h10]
MLYMKQSFHLAHSTFRARGCFWTSNRPLRSSVVSGDRAFSAFTALKSNENNVSHAVFPLKQPIPQLSNAGLIDNVRTTIQLFLARCNVQAKSIPFDRAFYQQCLDVAVQGGFPMSSSSPFSMLTYLHKGAIYGAIAGAHLNSPPLQTWLSLCTASFLFIDDIPKHFLRELPNMRLFNRRFVGWEKQGNVALEAVAGHLRRIPSIFGGPVSANLVTTSLLNAITGGVMEWDNKDMKLSASAEQYPSYLRSMSGIGGAYAIMAFPPDIPLEEYIQALPEIDFFISIGNDLLSFYKEELAGERTNYIAIFAARQGISRIEAFEQVGDLCAKLFEKIVIILEDSNEGAPGFSRAREAFEQYVEGMVAFHLSCDRYRLMEVGL